MINRCPKNIPGDFYTDGDCMACDLPETEAPSLLAELNENNYDTYFVKQPETKEEIEQAIDACKICCVNALRYGGKDREILKKLGEEYCDYRVLINGKIASTLTGKVIE